MTHNIENPDKKTGLSHTFAPLPNWILSRKEISITAKLIYARLLQYKGKKDHAYPRRQELADECGLELKTVARALRELKKFNLILAKRRGHTQSNIYTFPLHPWMADEKKYNSKNKINTQEEGDDVPDLSHHDRSDLSHHDRSDLSHHDRSDLSHHDIMYEKKIEKIIVEKKDDSLTFSQKNYDFKEEFQEFWNEYPLKRHRKLTYTHFITAMEIASFPDIMKKVKSYKRMTQKQGSEKFFISSHKWLEQERWHDDYGEFEKESKTIELLHIALDAPDEYKDSWEIISERLKERKGKTVHKSWFEKTCLFSVDEDTATIHTASRFVKDWVKTHFERDILHSVQHVYPGVSHLKFKVAPHK
jgi:hypothetical protein